MDQALVYQGEGFEDDWAHAMPELSRDRMLVFLRGLLTLRDGHVQTVTEVSSWLGVSLSVVNHWKRQYPAFREAYLATQEVRDAWLEDEAYRMGWRDGWWEERLDRDGKVVEKRLRRDPAMMRMILAGRMPEKYGRKDDTNIAVQVIIERSDERGDE